MRWFVLCLMAALLPVAAFAQSDGTAAEALRETLDLYRGIDTYHATVHSYDVRVPSLSESELASRSPDVVFSLYYRGPDLHAAVPVGPAPYGVFRVEVLTMLNALRTLDVRGEYRDRHQGRWLRMLRLASDHAPEGHTELWVDEDTGRPAKVSFYVNEFVLFTTEFRYGGGAAEEDLPTETRTSFPESTRIIVNRVARRDLNLVLPAGVFQEGRR